jgi:hypothetical protein
MKKTLSVLLLLGLACALLTGCGASAPASTQAAEAPAVTEAPAPAETEAPAVEAEPAPEAALPDGVYQAKFITDSSMFHVNEAYDDLGTLTVKDGVMTLHVSLVSKSILNLFLGKAEDAEKEGAVLLEPTTDLVDYGDGSEPEEVYGFDIPVPYLDEDFDLAIIGKKGVWYDHKVSVSDPQPLA